jgi:hypothetical protein
VIFETDFKCYSEGEDNATDESCPVYFYVPEEGGVSFLKRSHSHTTIRVIHIAVGKDKEL